MYKPPYLQKYAGKSTRFTCPNCKKPLLNVEQVENKFAYKVENGGNYNSGVYIMYYDQDLSTKQAQ